MAVFLDLPDEMICLILSFLPYRKDVVTALLVSRRILNCLSLYPASILVPVYVTEVLVEVASHGRAEVIHRSGYMVWGKHPEIRAILAESAFKALSQDGMTPDLAEVAYDLASLYCRMRQEDKQTDILERFCYNVDGSSIKTFRTKIELADLYVQKCRLQDAVDLLQHDLAVLRRDISNDSELLRFVPVFIPWYMQLGQVEEALEVLEWSWNKHWIGGAKDLATIYVQRNRRGDASAILWKILQYREGRGYPASSLHTVEMLAQLEEENGRAKIALDLLETSFWDTSRDLIRPGDELDKEDLHKVAIQRLEHHGEYLAKLYDRVGEINKAADFRVLLKDLHWLKEIICQNEQNHEKNRESARVAVLE